MVPFLLLFTCCASYNLYVLLIIINRIFQLSRLDEEALSKEERSGYINTLKKYILGIFLFVGIGAIGFFFKEMTSLVFPIISVCFLGRLHSKVLDEIQLYDVNKKDMDRLLEFRRMEKIDTSEKNKKQKGD